MSLKRRRDSAVSFDMPRFKRRRFGRPARRGYRWRGRKGQRFNPKLRQQGYASTTRWGRPHSTPYRAKRIGRRRWRGILWRDTLNAQHYRSLGSGLQPLTGPAVGTPNASAVYLFPALQTLGSGVFQPYHSNGLAFWENGVENPDIGVPVPLFRGDITLRGGIARLTVGAYPENVILRVKVYAIWANKNPDIDVYAMNNTNRQVEWDPSLYPEFSTKFGKILYMKEAMIPVGEVFEITHRFKPQKIDQAVFRGELPVPSSQPAEPAGNQLWWGVVVVPLDLNLSSASITCINSWSLSFSADAIGTT